MKVWKYSLDVVDHVQSHQIPIGSSLLHCEKQGKVIGLWFKVHPGNPLNTRSFVVQGTGHELRGGTAHVGSVVIGDFVWHVFEL